MEILVLGSGDALGCGGRGQPAYLIQHGEFCALLDCGAHALSALHREGINPGEIDLVLVSHLHGDHLAGIPFLFLEYQVATRRDKPLVVAGPPGLETKVESLFRIMYTETVEMRPRRFEVQYVVLKEGVPATFGPLQVLAYKVVHQHQEVPYGYRITGGGHILAYSGDTEWNEALGQLARGADLFLCECYMFSSKVRFHSSWSELMPRLEGLGCGQIVLMHPFREMLDHLEEVPLPFAEEGMRLTV